MPARDRNRIVVLHAGGTIMSSESGDFFPTIDLTLGDQTHLVKNLHERFGDLFGDSDLGGFDFEYSPVPGGPWLSEDACVEYWNHVLQGLTEAHDIHGDRLAGIIVLHGTDTMAYAAPMVAFRTSGLQYPVVLTGANNTPKRAYDAPLLDLGTDAWENIYAAAAFIAQKGSTLPGVFVSFASRIHFPFNLRKRQNAASGTDPLWEIGSSRFNRATVKLLKKKHRFRFENVNLPAPYVARIINGDVQFAQPEGAIRELNRNLNPPTGNGTAFRQLGEAASGCWFLKVSPAQPFLFSDAYLGDSANRSALKAEMERRGVSLVVLGGYKSATVPTRASNSVKDFCELCRESGIAVVLTTRSGCGDDPPYGPTAELDLTPVRVMISETAVAAGFHTLDRVGAESGKGHRRDRIRDRLGSIDDRLRIARDFAEPPVPAPSPPGGQEAAGVLEEVLAQRCDAPGQLAPESFADAFRFGFALGIKTWARQPAEQSLGAAIEEGCRALEAQGFGQPEIHLAPAEEGSPRRKLWCKLRPLSCGGLGARGGAGSCSCHSWLWRGILHGAVCEFGWRASAEARERALPTVERACRGEARPVVEDKMRTLWIKRTRTRAPGDGGRIEVSFEEPEAFLRWVLDRCR
jgi:Asparaginase, N-terminal